MKDRVTIPQGFVLAVLVAGISGFTSVAKDYFGDSAAAKQHQQDMRDIKAMRDREVDDLKARLAAVEARNCKP